MQCGCQHSCSQAATALLFKVTATAMLLEGHLQNARGEGPEFQEDGYSSQLNPTEFDEGGLASREQHCHLEQSKSKGGMLRACLRPFMNGPKHCEENGPKRYKGNGLRHCEGNGPKRCEGNAAVAWLHALYAFEPWKQV